MSDPTNKNGASYVNPYAFTYIWNRYKSRARPGIALGNTTDGQPRIFIRDKEQAHALVKQIVDLALDPNTWKEPNK